MTLSSRTVLRIGAAALVTLVVALTLWSRLFAQDGLLYQQYDVGITLREDGSFRVRSEQRVRFDDEYNTAFLEIPTEHATEISDIAVYEEAPRFTVGGGLKPLDFTATQDGETLYIDWEYDTTLAGEIRTFVVEYTVTGGIWVYDDYDVLQWFAINADRSGLPILSSQVTLHLPESLAALTGEGVVTAEVVSGNGDAFIEDDTVIYAPDSALPDGEAFEIDLQFPHGALPVTMQPWQRDQAEAAAVASIPNLDVALAIQADGLIDVTEDIEVAVESGALYSGYRTINALYQDEIRNVRVYQDGRPLSRGVEGCDACYTASFTPSSRGWARYNSETGQVEIDEDAVGRMEIRWWMPAIEAGEKSEFSVRYTVVGGVRTGNNDQVINFDVLPEYDLPISAATLQIAPPPGITPDRIKVESGAAQSEPQVTDAGAILLRNQELPATGARWQVVLSMPPDATTATTPEWQQQFESAVAAGNAYEQAQARRTLISRVGALLAIVGAIGAAAWAWLRFGRRRANEMLKGYIAEPPDDLAPGIVAYLIDRKTSERGVLASLFHLAAAGLLDVDLSSGIQIRRKQAEPIVANRAIRTAQGAVVPIEDHQAAIFNDVLVANAPLNAFVPLDALASPLRAALPDIFSKMGKDAQEFFVSGALSGSIFPRRLFNTLAMVAFLLIGFFTIIFMSGDGSTSTLMLIALFAFAVFLVVFGMRRPFGGNRRSATGEAEAEKWTRFRNYLLNLKEYGDLGAAQEILDRYFAYAVALGAESVVLAQAESMGAHLPPWTPIPTHYPYDFPSTSHSNSSTGANWPRPDLEPRPMGQAMPAPVAASQPQGATPAASLSGMSAAMGESLSSGSKSLGRSLTVAAGGPGAAGAVATTVVLNSALKQRTMQFEANATPTQMLDDIMRQSLSDARVITTRPTPSSGMRSSGGSSGRSSGGSSGGSFWGGSSSGSSRSSGGFGGSSSSSSGSSWSSSSSSRSSSSSTSSSSSSSSSRSSSSSGSSGFGKR